MSCQRHILLFVFVCLGICLPTIVADCSAGQKYTVINDNRDADAKCSKLCAGYQAFWTGDWASSPSFCTCGCPCDSPNKSGDFAAGVALAANNAAVVCPTVCTSMGLTMTWNGNWRNPDQYTFPYVPVCGCTCATTTTSPTPTPTIPSSQNPTANPTITPSSTSCNNVSVVISSSQTQKQDCAIQCSKQGYQFAGDFVTSTTTTCNCLNCQVSGTTVLDPTKLIIVFNVVVISMLTWM